MAQIPPDAQRSEDGQWWWDGSQWQPVGPQGDAGSASAASAAEQAAGAAQTATPASGQLSDDGQWQWDGSQWQPVQAGNQNALASGGSQGSAGTAGDAGGSQGSGGTGGDAGAAEFGFDNNGLIVQVDQSDNPDNHVVLNANAGTEAVFTVCNMGSASGTATVTIYVDDQQVQTWTSGDIAAGQCEGANVSGCGRHPAGSHTFRAVVTPGHSGNDEATNSVDIEDS
ncbi:MAG TPA: hypothetical protein VMU65_05550 [Candidatus Saccharimonadales bacterium]|nr:hypothetical protein [Candidatus Saccharimonadales bacterium]